MITLQQSMQELYEQATWSMPWYTILLICVGLTLAAAVIIAAADNINSEGVYFTLNTVTILAAIITAVFLPIEINQNTRESARESITEHLSENIRENYMVQGVEFTHFGYSTPSAPQPVANLVTEGTNTKIEEVSFYYNADEDLLVLLNEEEHGTEAVIPREGSKAEEYLATVPNEDRVPVE